MTSQDARPRLLLLHGGGLGPWSYDRHVAALSSDFRCLVPLLPGHGSRSHEPFLWDSAVKDLVTLLESEGGSAFVAGLSLGGQLGLALAAERPDLVDGLFVTGANTHGIPMLGPALALTKPFLRLKNHPSLSAASAKRMGIPVNERVLFLEGARAMSATALESFLRASAGFRAPDRLRALTCPALIVRGQKEAGVIKKSVPEVAALIPGAQARVAPGLQHPWPLEDPGLFVETCVQWFLNATVPSGLVSA